MIPDNYEPEMKAVLCPPSTVSKPKGGKLVYSRTAPPTIRASLKYLQSIMPFSEPDYAELARQQYCVSMCPAIWWFHDTPEIRRILKYEQQ